jgi:hypothetical protein
MCEANAATTPHDWLAIVLGSPAVGSQPTSIHSENLAAENAVANPHGLNEFLTCRLSSDQSLLENGAG